MALNIMVLESEYGAADDAARELTAAGHVVLRCHDPGAPVFPCRGLVEASHCPLRSHVVDVALTVRAGVSSQPGPAEDGVRCALLSRVPLVVSGPSVFDPYAGFETRVLNRADDVVAACEETAEANLGAHAVHARAAIHDTPAFHGHEPSATVSVKRRNGGLDVEVTGLDGWSPTERHAAVVRIVGALRRFDRSARTIDVVVEDSSG